LTYAKPTVPHRSPVVIGDLLSTIESMGRIRAAERRIAIECRWSSNDRSQIAIIDETQIESALSNLVLNAVDAVSDGGAVTISGNIESDTIRIEVENTGPAISAANVNRIFEPFFTTKTGGTGLGLAIARAMTRAHGGDVWVSRNEEGHVVFTMTLTTHCS
jgi:signal transduction histidine kinase